MPLNPMGVLDLSIVTELLIDEIKTYWPASQLWPTLFSDAYFFPNITGLTPEATAQLTASLPVHEGDVYSEASALQTRQAVKTFDEHLGVHTTATAASGSQQLDLTISPEQRIKVGGAVITASIVSKVQPAYPADAKAARIQGVVHLSAIIGMDGSVQQLTVLSGPPELVQSALDAVKQWVYKPTMLNGNPVQVETTVDVNFTLAQ